MTETATPKRRRTSAAPDAPSVAPETAPDKTPHPAPRTKDAPRTMKDLRLAHHLKRKPSSKAEVNPLREGLRLERVPDPSTLVLFGATGDLAHRKVIPALYHLWRTNLLPHEFVVLAIGRRDYDDETLRADFRASLEKYSRVLPLDEAAWRSFCARIRYQRCDFDDPTAFDRLVTILEGIDKEQGLHAEGRGNHLFYLATQPSAFAEIVGQLGRVGLDHEHHDGGWRRIVIEKPFGHDLNSAIRLNREVGKVFRESQVYRIDHYLGKETVRNLLVFRFGNGIFEPIWNRRHIDHIQITVAESIGVENRGAFYEETGASRDFLQNHLLQLMSLVAMEPPATFDADALRDEKVKVIRAIGELDPHEIQRDVVRGQYGPGWVAGRAGQGLPPGGRSRPRVRDGDVRRGPLRGRRLALVRRPLLPPNREAPAEAGIGDRDPVQGGPAPALPRLQHRAGGEPACDPDPAGRGDHAAVRREGAGPRDRRPVGHDGLHVRLGVHRGLPRRVRDADPGRAPGRRVAVHAGGRGRGRLGPGHADHRRVGGCGRAGLPELRSGDLGTRGSRRAPGSRGQKMATDLSSGPVERALARPNEPVLRWRSRARSIEEVEQELARIWAHTNLEVDINGDGVNDERHVAARTSVMNLVVIARRPEVGERSAAIIQMLTGRHPSRTMIVQPADPDGPPWLDAQIVAHCVMPRSDAPETCAETIHLTCGGESGRHLDTIIAPLLIHDLPVTIWWPDDPPFGTHQANDVLSTADRLVVDGSGWHGTGLPLLVKMAAAAEQFPIAISDFALLRQSRWREAIAAIFDIPDFLPYLRHIRRIAVTYAVRDEFGAETTNIVKPLYHAAWIGSRLGMHVVKPLGATQVGGPRRCHGAPEPARQPERRPGRLPADGSNGRLRRHPPGALGDAVGDHDPRRAARGMARVGAPGRRHRRAGSRPRPRLAGRRPRAGARLQRSPPDGHRPAGGGDRGRRTGSRGRRDAGARRRACARCRRRGRDRRMSEPTVVTLADAAACSLAAAERIVEILDVAIDDRGEAHWATTGGSAPASIYQHLAAAPLRDELDWRKVRLWWTDDRYVPFDHPLSNAKIAFDHLLDSGAFGGQSGTGESGADVQVGRAPGVPIRPDDVHPFPVGVAIGEGRDPDWCAARYVEELRADGPEEDDDGLPAFDLILLGIGPDGHILSVFPGSAAFDSRAWAVGVPAPTHVEPHVARVTLHPGLVPAAREILVVSHGDGKADILHEILTAPVEPRRLPAQLARQAGATWILDKAAAARL